MDVSAIRLANLRSLVTQLTAGGRAQKQAAIDLGMAASFLSQLVGGKKMGDEVARKIEEIRHLPHGWMDQQHLSVQEHTVPYHVLRIDPATIAAAVRLVRLSFTNLSLEFNNEEDGVPLAFAYEYLLDQRQSAVTPDNLVDFSKRLAERLREQNDDDAGQGDTRHTGGSDRATGARRKAS